MESDKKPLKQKKSFCGIFHSPVDTRSSNSVHPNCSSNGLLGGLDTGSIRSSWCADDDSDDTAYLQLDAGKTMSIGGALIQGRAGNFNEYVTRLKFSFSANGIDWVYVDDGMSFDGNDNSFCSQKIVYSKVYKARYLRFIPIEFFGRKSIRAAMLICNEECTPSLYNPPADRRQHNGVRSDCGLGLLGGIAWCAATKNLLSSGAYLQIDSGKVSRISGSYRRQKRLK